MLRLTRILAPECELENADAHAKTAPAAWRKRSQLRTQPGVQQLTPNSELLNSVLMTSLKLTLLFKARLVHAAIAAWVMRSDALHWHGSFQTRRGGETFE